MSDAGLEVHGVPFAKLKYDELAPFVTWHHHSEYRTLDIWRAYTHIDNVEHAAHLYKCNVDRGHIAVGHTLNAIKDAIRDYLGEGGL